MSTYSVDVPARRSAWLADNAYQMRLTEQARRLAAASMPDTDENTELAERDEVRVRFTFRETEVPARRSARRFGCRRVVCIALLAVD